MKVHFSTSTSRPRLRRFALALAAIAHVLAVFIAPIADGGDRQVGAHVEEAGTSQHHSHVATTCIVCAGHPLVAHAAPDAFRLTVGSMRASSRAPLSVLPTLASTGAPVGSRAPPSIA